MIASVGVCTRPTVVSWKPPDLELNAVMARVPLMPTSQSDSERQVAASASGRMASSVAQCREAVADRGGASSTAATGAGWAWSVFANWTM